MENYSPFLIENGRFSNVSYEVNTSQASTSHSRYILHVSVQFIMITDRDRNNEREYDIDPIGIRFHEHYYIPLCDTNRGSPWPPDLTALPLAGVLQSPFIQGVFPLNLGIACLAFQASDWVGAFWTSLSDLLINHLC